MGNRNTLEHPVIFDPMFMNGFKFRGRSQTLAGAVTIDRDDNTLLHLDPGGASRNVTMPTAENGLMFLINNIADAAEDLVIKNPAATTIGTISQDEAALVLSDGTSWYVRMVGTTT